LLTAASAPSGPARTTHQLKVKRQGLLLLFLLQVAEAQVLWLVCDLLDGVCDGAGRRRLGDLGGGLLALDGRGGRVQRVELGEVELLLGLLLPERRVEHWLRHAGPGVCGAV
jgi:hypothetical protein